MHPFKVPAGAKMLLGAPAQPMAREKAAALAQLVSSIEGILEAHLPQCFLVGVMESPAQVLVILIAHTTNQQAVLDSLSVGMSKIIPAGEHLDVWPVTPNSSILKNVQATGCQVFRRAMKRPWWKFW